MGEGPSARTQRELGELRSAIDGDVDALIARARADADPRDLVRRNPLAVIGSAGALASAALVAIARRRRRARVMEGKVDEVIERLGGRIERLRGGARKRFRQQLKKEMARVRGGGPREAVWSTAAAAAAALAATLARGFGRRLVADDDPEPGTEV